MTESLRASVAVLAVMTLLTGVAYPLLITAVARLVLPRQAEGSLVRVEGKAVGSSLIGQPFSRPEYLWGRPSATSPIPYNAAASAGSNLGPGHPDLAGNARSRVEALRKYDGNLKAIPADLATASGSGLDPHISPASAEAQVGRVARARNRPESDVRAAVARHTEGRQLGVLGEPRVNVLLVNLDLDGKLAAGGPEGSTRP